MRRVYTEKEIRDNYPHYKEANLFFVNSFLYIIGPENGPYKIGRSSKLLSRFQSLCCNNHMNLMLYFAMPTPAGLGLSIEKEVHKMLSCAAVKKDWYDVPLSMAKIAMIAVNPLAPRHEFINMTYTAMLSTPDGQWMKMGIPPLDRKVKKTIPKNNF